jgi:hypothetical protein
MCAGSRHPSIGIDGQGAGGTAEAHGRGQEGSTGTFLPNSAELLGSCLIQDIRRLPNFCLFLPQLAWQFLQIATAPPWRRLLGTNVPASGVAGKKTRLRRRDRI